MEDIVDKFSLPQNDKVVLGSLRKHRLFKAMSKSQQADEL